MRSQKPRWFSRLLSRREKGRVSTADRHKGTAPSPGDGPWAAGATDTGRKREANEDAFICDPGRGLFVIADGMGGHAAGDLASNTAVATVSQALTAARIREALSRGGGAVEDMLAETLHQANTAVLAAARENPGRAGMGSTAVVGILGDRRLHVANLGDSRAYVIRSGEAQQLTKDHTMAAVLYEQGQLTAEEARSHAIRNHLTKLLGLDRPVTPTHATISLCPADRLLLCSDGLWDALPNEEMSRITSSAAYAAEAVDMLIGAANEAGGSDNITAVVVFIAHELGNEQARSCEPRDGTAEVCGGQEGRSTPTV